jgi:hypothetical protein
MFSLKSNLILIRVSFKVKPSHLSHLSRKAICTNKGSIFRLNHTHHPLWTNFKQKCKETLPVIGNILQKWSTIYKILRLVTEWHGLKRYCTKSPIQFNSILLTLPMNNFGFIPVTNFNLDSKINFLHHSNLNFKLPPQNFNIAAIREY